MAKIVKCPHCGAHNPYSLLITVCQECKGDLSGVEPCDEPVEQDAGQAAPPETLATTRPEVAPAESPPPAAPRTEAPSIVTTRTSGVDPTTQPVRPTEAERGAEPPVAEPGESAAVATRRQVPIVEVDRPPIVPRPSAAPRDRSAERAASQIICGQCGYINVTGVTSCMRCKAPLQAGQEVEPAGFRSCPRCGHTQDAGRNSCEKCGMHFVGPAASASAALTRQPLTRAPKGSAEDATKVVATGFGCFIAVVVTLWFLFRLMSEAVLR
jgi:hypothetical protein